MKIYVFGLTTTAAAIGVLWLTIGGAATGVLFGAVLLLAVLVIGLAAGSRWTADTMERGAKIALAAQVSDDRRDMVQINALSGLARDMLKLGREATKNEPPRYPPMLSAGSGSGGSHPVVEGEFRIDGLPDEDEGVVQ